MNQILKDSELRYRRLFEATQDGILILDARTGMIEDVNPYLIKMLGYSREELVEKKLWEVGAFKDIEASKDAFEALQANEYIRYEDLPLKTKDGQLIQVEFVSNVYLVGDEKVIQCDIRDITEHRRIIAALQGNENKYHDLINQSPDGYFIIELSGNILTVNKAMCKELEFSEEEFLSMNIWDIIPQQYLDQYKERLTKILEGKSLKEAAEYVVRGKNGGVHYVEVLSAPRYSGKDIIGFQGIARDITARKRSEDALQESEAKFRRLVAHLPTVVYINAVGDAGSTLYVSPQIETLLGYTPQEWLADPKLWSKTLHPEDRQYVLKQAALTDQSNKPFDMEYRMVHRAGRLVWVHDEVILVKDMEGQPQFWQGIMLDITERKQAEETLREKERLLSESQSIGHMGSWSYDILADTLHYSDEMYRLLDTSPQDRHNQAAFLSLIYASDRPMVTKWMEDIKAGRQVKELDFRLFSKNGELRYIQSRGAVLFDSAGNPARFIGTAQDVSERKLAEIQIRQQIQRLTALGKIDQAIISTSNLSFLMETILSQVVAQLQVDAADVLLLDPNSEMLDCVAGQGFRTPVAETAQVPIGRSVAGRAVKERRLVKIENLQEKSRDSGLSERLAGESFVSYFGVPLITKGGVTGVLEVFHRTPLHPYAEWLDFLNTLAGQAAIAIENASLVTNLEQSNRELSQAYDATIEGWSRALDLRDKETEGHTLRVTESTLLLAHKFNFTDAQMLYIRWGALLHDIGKMGIPDNILLKPDKLSEEEWAIMRKHPQYAYDLLQPIAFLTPALDIPYCHHEKWDGTGYPRGLKGEEIPLSARIFAVVDVWDALCSDRPYRPRWSEEKIREHICTLSGTHFAPQVVDMFMQMPNQS
ncbi:MAG: PAS domain S-box protein [Chloroflexi bacterium]|nr:MAG: PAS domain S-box protein [Chloroflexota bacterium]